MLNNKEELAQLGDGYHYGEWVGPKIQDNRHNFDEKRFLLFNVYRWGDKEDRPNCCGVVPKIWEAFYYHELPKDALAHLCDSRDYEPEGVMLYFHAFDKYLKHTLKNPEGKWL